MTSKIPDDTYDTWVAWFRQTQMPSNKVLLRGGYNELLAEVVCRSFITSGAMDLKLPLHIQVKGPLEVEVVGYGDGLDANLVERLGGEAITNLTWRIYETKLLHVRGGDPCPDISIDTRDKLDFKNIVPMSDELHLLLSTTKGRVYEQSFRRGQPITDGRWRARRSDDPALALSVTLEAGWVADQPNERFDVTTLSTLLAENAIVR